ncbi:hypothetical protein MSHOH_0904 [Methanosarcina horonobensis HB-1 = JCM 15518]|uniref:Uncharacterized protein n=1 Tax=Methanosarcina horonobensis HB-1 = JCM 15518 TaxID=1434110 RepID=A0A0E3SBZ3_9EURY|nr:hypothetical protein [Methanosarcina horonobensis]AKB77387.1 hypothetical protein MSHOH_0904 [Methanosarcina horonobensis HB-1 = JCM 15518]
MTNVPTLDGILLFVFVLTFIPFWTAFVICYVVYRRLGIGLLGGLTGIISFVLTAYLLDSALWIRGIIAGVFGGIILVIALSRHYKPIIPNFRVDNRTVAYTLVIVGLILSIYLYYSSEKADLEFCIDDPSDDVSYSGYTEPKLAGHDNIDILRLKSRVVEDSVLLEMELAGEIDENSTAEYTYYIATQEQSLWTLTIDEKDMEKEGNILRAYIPVESFKNRKIFHVVAVASEYDMSTDLNLNDSCSNRGDFWEILRILTS